MTPDTLTLSTAHEQLVELFQRTHRHALSLAYRIIGDRNDAEDVTQVAYRRGWRHFGEFEVGRSFEAWILAITRNCALDLLRRQARAPAPSLDGLVQTGGDRPPLYCEAADQADGPEEVLLSRILGERLEAAPSSLPGSWRQAILLGDVEQRPCQEIAAEMHWKMGTVRSRLHRARQHRRRSLETSGYSPVQPSAPSAMPSADLAARSRDSARQVGHSKTGRKAPSEDCWGLKLGM